MTKTTPDGAGITQQKRKKLAKKEARLMLAIAEAKKNIKKTEEKISGAQGQLRTCTEELHSLEEKLARLQHPSDDVLSDIILPGAETEPAATDQQPQITVEVITDSQESIEAEIIESINIIVSAPSESDNSTAEAHTQDEAEKTPNASSASNPHTVPGSETLTIPPDTISEAQPESQNNHDHASTQEPAKTTRSHKKKSNNTNSES